MGQRLGTLAPGVLSIGTYFVNPPFEYLAAGRQIGARVSSRRKWEVILQQMQQRLFDCIIGGITITPARRRILAWSAPYMTTTLSLIVGARTSMSSISDLRRGVVGIQAATADYDAAVRMQRTGEIGGVRLYPFARIADAVTDLRAGPDDPRPLGIGFASQNTALRDSVDGVLQQMDADGTLARFRAAADG